MCRITCASRSAGLMDNSWSVVLDEGEENLSWQSVMVCLVGKLPAVSGAAWTIPQKKHRTRKSEGFGASLQSWTGTQLSLQSPSAVGSML